MVGGKLKNRNISAWKFAKKYNKRFGGAISLEGVAKGDELFPSVPEELRPVGVVALKGYLEYNKRKADRTGRQGEPIRTGYVVSLAAHDGNLYAITSDAVYLVYGPFAADIIKGDEYLKSLWEDLKKTVIQKYEKLNKDQ